MANARWVLGAGLLLAIPVWAWNGYPTDPVYGAGGTHNLQLQRDVDNLQRQVRDLEREVDQLRARQSGAGANKYPLPGQTMHGFRAVRDGAYELSLNGATLRIDRNGGLQIKAAGPLRLEGETVTSHARNQAAQ